MDESNPRPISVTILTVFVLSITSWNLLRVYSTMVNWDILREFGASPAYIMSSGLIWTIAGLWLSYAIWRGKRQAFAAGLALAGLHFAWYWLDRLAVQTVPAPNLVFSVVVSVVLLIYFSLSLFAAKVFFDKERG